MRVDCFMPIRRSFDSPEAISIRRRGSLCWNESRVVADCLQFERVVWQIDSFDEHSFERVYKDFAESEKENSIVRDVEVRQFRIFLRAAAQTVDRCEKEPSALKTSIRLRSLAI